MGSDTHGEGERWDLGEPGGHQPHSIFHVPGLAQKKGEPGAPRGFKI